MTGERLEFQVCSNGRISVDLIHCGSCETRACLEVCHEQGGPLVLDEVQGVPKLRWSLEETERGGCVECLGCELACELYGHHAVTIDLPLGRLDDYLATLTQPVVYDQRDDYVHPH